MNYAISDVISPGIFPGDGLSLPSQMPSTASARPRLADIERLSRGLSATRRGTGSRNVPHRLNASERTGLDVALRRGFATVRGDGERRHAFASGSPLLNVLRQRCDALSTPLVWVERSRVDHVVVDVAPLRCTDRADVESVLAACDRVAAREAAVRPAPRTPCSPPTVEQLRTLPIWRLLPITARYAVDPAAPGDEKLSKRLAGALVARLARVGDELESRVP